MANEVTATGYALRLPVATCALGSVPTNSVCRRTATGAFPNAPNAVPSACKGKGKFVQEEVADDDDDDEEEEEEDEEEEEEVRSSPALRVPTNADAWVTAYRRTIWRKSTPP